MDLNQWRAAQQETVSLPSGLTVTLRRVKIKQLVMRGKVPKPLLVEIRELETAGSGEISLDGFGTLLDNYDKLGTISGMLDVVVGAALLNPEPFDQAEYDRLGTLEDRAQYFNSHVKVEEMDPDDSEFIFNWASRGTKEIARFPDGQPRGDETAGRDSAAVRAEAEQLVPGDGRLDGVSA